MGLFRKKAPPESRNPPPNVPPPPPSGPVGYHHPGGYYPGPPPPLFGRGAPAGYAIPLGAAGVHHSMPVLHVPPGMQQAPMGYPPAGTPPAKPGGSLHRLPHSARAARSVSPSPRTGVGSGAGFAPRQFSNVAKTQSMSGPTNVSERMDKRRSMPLKEAALMVEEVIKGATVVKVFDGDNILIKDLPPTLPKEVYNLVQTRTMQLEHGLQSEAERITHKLQELGYHPDDSEKKVYRKKKVRLRGTIAPLEGQHFHKEATNWLEYRVRGRQVNAFVYETDKHNRFVADICLLEDNRLIQVEMLKEGYTWHYALQDKRCEFSSLEEEARRDGRGMWGGQDAERLQPPWIFRKQQRDSRNQT